MSESTLKPGHAVIVAGGHAVDFGRQRPIEELERELEAARLRVPKQPKSACPDLVVRDLNPDKIWAKFNGAGDNILRRGVLRAGRDAA